MSTSAIIWQCCSGRVLSCGMHGVEQERRIRRLFLDTILISLKVLIWEARSNHKTRSGIPKGASSYSRSCFQS
jgi:hypothetical protein